MLVLDASAMAESGLIESWYNDITLGRFASFCRNIFKKI
jgi:hypothetical protein